MTNEQLTFQLSVLIPKSTTGNIMKKITWLAVILVITFIEGSYAANTVTNNVTISKIDATKYNGDIRVQTEPRPNISGLACTSNFWLVLKPSNPSFEEIYAFLLSAKISNLTVTVGADDEILTGQFCELSRLVVE